MKSYCILGNCQANAIASTLQACAQFKQSFALQRIKPIHRISAEEHTHFLNDILPGTSLFMYQPISEGYRGGGFGFARAINHHAESTPVFDEAAAYLTQYDNTAVRIVGHMSKDENSADLDQQRASCVAEELAKRGAQPVRMKLVGMGARENLSSNPAVGDPTVDRRVELLFSTM